MTLTPAQLRAWAERLEGLSEDFDTVRAVIREMREAAGEGAREQTGVRDGRTSAVVDSNLSPAEAPCEPALSPAPAEPELWGVWYWLGRPEYGAWLRRDVGGEWSGTEEEARAKILAMGFAVRAGWHYEAREIREPALLPAETGLWGVWCSSPTHDGCWIEEPFTDLSVPPKRLEVLTMSEAQEMAHRAQANYNHAMRGVAASMPRSRYEARPIPRGRLPTSPGHYELTPSGEWRKVERSGK
jgi:hypothetical protein